jgi:hypothetical protein
VKRSRVDVRVLLQHPELRQKNFPHTMLIYSSAVNDGRAAVAERGEVAWKEKTKSESTLGCPSRYKTILHSIWLVFLEREHALADNAPGLV